MSSNRYLSDLDGLRTRLIFCTWTGDEAMSANRIQALWTIYNTTACPVVFITKASVERWVKPGAPLHPAFPYLSSTHKADYLRCYLMHHYGGGYTDVKLTTKTWGPFFDLLEDSDKLALGYTELAHGIPHVSGGLGDQIRAAHAELIGLCAFIFRRNTPLTRAWLEQTEQLLDAKLASLQQNPARHPMDQTGVTLPDGTISAYPLRWAEMLGEIFHPLIYQYRPGLLRAPIEPIFASYR